jgi:hypothetical protein
MFFLADEKKDLCPVMRKEVIFKAIYLYGVLPLTFSEITCLRREHVEIKR